jgi:hypothetical protein
VVAERDGGGGAGGHRARGLLRRVAHVAAPGRRENPARGTHHIALLHAEEVAAHQVQEGDAAPASSPAT